MMNLEDQKHVISEYSVLCAVLSTVIRTLLYFFINKKKIGKAHYKGSRENKYTEPQCTPSFQLLLQSVLRTLNYLNNWVVNSQQQSLSWNNICHHSQDVYLDVTTGVNQMTSLPVNCDMLPSPRVVTTIYLQHTKENPFGAA